MKRRWLIVMPFAGEWRIVTRRWTEWGADRKARRVARNPFPGVLTPIHTLVDGVGYCHEDEYDSLPELGNEGGRL